MYKCKHDSQYYSEIRFNMRVNQYAYYYFSVKSFPRSKHICKLKNNCIAFIKMLSHLKRKKLIQKIRL